MIIKETVMPINLHLIDPNHCNLYGPRQEEPELNLAKIVQTPDYFGFIETLDQDLEGLVRHFKKQQLRLQPVEVFKRDR